MSKTAHQVLEEAGIDKARLQTTLDGENWGRLVHAFETVTAIAALLATWPEENE